MRQPKKSCLIKYYWYNYNKSYLIKHINNNYEFFTKLNFINKKNKRKI